MFEELPGIFTLRFKFELYESELLLAKRAWIV
jgi:hypothetical protein